MTDAPRLIMTKGLPGSGKTSWAEQYQREHPETVLISRDDLRRMLHAGKFSRTNEKQVVQVEGDIVADALARDRTVIVHDTNLDPANHPRLQGLADVAGVELVVQDFTDVDLETCIKRDLTRLHSVGSKVIRGMWSKYLAPPADPAPEFIEGLPSAVMVDVDGTVARMVNRGPYDESLYHTDVPNAPVVALVRDLAAAGETIIFCSGRDAAYYEVTRDWLAEHVFEGHLPDQTCLFMRPAGDKRHDDEVKAELFEKHIRGHFNVRFALDDRTRVVQAWRRLGITCLQVAEGDF